MDVSPLTEDAPIACLVLQDDVLLCTGQWTLANQPEIKAKILSLKRGGEAIVSIDGSSITAMDSVGALLIYKLLEFGLLHNQHIKISGLSPRFQYLLDLVEKDVSLMQSVITYDETDSLFFQFGWWISEKTKNLLDFFAFIGEFFLVVVKVLKNLRRLRPSSIIKIIETAGALALPIVGLMSFLIGVVLVYQLGTQLKMYGATIYVVQVSGIGIIREFAPLITAVILAGRTSTSFAALIGSMKINEEIDALKTMGFAPFETLVLPRVIAMLIVMPLLIVWADIFGVLGSMVMAKESFGISYSIFINQFAMNINVTHYVLGLVKAPVFSLIIACVGCFQGLRVQFGSQAVGLSTTKAAVQAIFLIIVADAAFSIIFSMMGL